MRSETTCGLPGTNVVLSSGFRHSSILLLLALLLLYGFGGGGASAAVPEGASVEAAGADLLIDSQDDTEPFLPHDQPSSLGNCPAPAVEAGVESRRSTVLTFYQPRAPPFG